MTRSSPHSGAAASTLADWFGLAGLNVLVTGAGSGIAEAVALAMAQAGAFVIVGDASRDEAERVAGSIEGQGLGARAMAIDVADEPSVVSAFGAIARDPGRLDVLYLGATRQGGCAITDMRADQWDWMMDVNLRGAFLCSREAVRMMQRDGRGGRILAQSTMGSLHPVVAGNFAYGPSKAGINMLMRNIAHDHAVDGIRANAILAGNVMTNAPTLTDCPPLPSRRFDENRIPFGQGSAEDVARLAVYLAGPSASYISGQCIAIDGGFSAL